MPYEPLLKLADILTVAALVLGPILAIQVQKFLDRSTEGRDRRLWVFKTLMATRHATLSIDHVSALNRIDLEFPDNKKYHQVIEAWKLYFNHLSVPASGEKNIEIWIKESDNLLANLLYEMSKSLNYDFDLSLIKRNIYSPRWHAKIENENQMIREKLIEVFDGKRPLPLDVQTVAWNEELYYKRGISYDQLYQRPQVKEAMDDYKKSIKLGFRISDSYLALGMSNLLRDDSLALHYFNKCLELDPTNSLATQFKQQLETRIHEKPQ